MGQDPEEIVYVDNGRGLMEPEAKVKSDQRDRREYWDRVWDRAGPWVLPAAAVWLLLTYAIEQWLRR
jgi:hypothetical protein